MRLREILFEYDNLIPQPNTLQVDVSSYEFIQLIKQFRAEKDTRSKGDKGLVMFYTNEEKKEFERFLNSKGISFKDIGSK